MAKTETPEKKTEVVDFSKLDSNAKLEMFKEALKSDDFKNIDLAKELDIKAPEPIKDETNKNDEAIAKLLPSYEETRGKLIELGHKFEKESKMSEIEKTIIDRLEKQSQAKLSDQIVDLVKLDADFPSDIVKNMEIPTEDKLIVAAGMKELVIRNTDAIKKVQTELDTAATELKDAKLASPLKEKEDRTGAEKVDSMMSEFGMKSPEKSPETKKKE